MRAASLASLALLLAGCGSEPEGPSPGVRADLVRLHEIIDADPATEPLELADRRIDDDRPVHAAEILERTGIPAAQRQFRAMRDVRVTTDEGRGFARRLATAYEERVNALDAYRVVLAGGAGADPIELLDALRRVRQAQEALLAIVSEMNALVPRPAPPPGGPAAPGDEEDAPGAGAPVDGTPSPE